MTDSESIPEISLDQHISTSPEFSIEYNSTRILFILKFGGIKGTLDSKIKFTLYDYLLRYPICLKKVFDEYEINESFTQIEILTIDKKMVKGISSAWDWDYYNYFAFLISRDLISFSDKVEFKMCLTEDGNNAVKKLRTLDTSKWERRSKKLKKIFGKKSDEFIRKFIKENFSFSVI